MPALPPFSQLSLSARLYVLATIAVSLAMVGFGLWFQPLSPIPTLLYLAVGTQIAALLPIRWRNGVQYVFDPLLVATGLYSPGGGVGLVAWLATFDGRVPSRATPLWVLVFNRAMYGISHVLPSIAASMIAPDEWWSLPIRTAFYVLASVAINYLVAARALSLANKAPFWNTLEQNVGGFSTLTSTAILAFSGGILFNVLILTKSPVGYLMAPALFGFILAVRGNVADAQRQTELKDQTLELAAQALDARDRYTESHSIRVAELAGRLGERLDLGDRECELLRTAGSLHDLGKIGVRDDILNKPGPLTDDEWDIMRRHPDIGADMIAQHAALAEVAPLVRHHHERWDGSGYPAGLKGDVIPFGARILSVADSFDTITGTRLYRRSLMTPQEGVEDISRRAGHWYDPNVVDALRALHGVEPLDLPERPEVPRRISALRVLRVNPSFAKLVTAIGVSALGDPLTQVAALVTIYAATNKDPRAVAGGFIAQALGTIVMSGALGGIADRFSRRQLIVSLELLRAGLLLSTPFLAVLSPWLIIAVLFLLAAANAIVQPARQAAIPGVVQAGQVGRANAIVSATTYAAGAIGFALAGAILGLGQLVGAHMPSGLVGALVGVAQGGGIHKATDILFIVDALTFASAGLLVLGIPNLGGGLPKVRVTGSLRRAWGVEAARPHLVISGVAAFLLAISFPALLALAYKLSPQDGAQAYSILEVVVSIGVFAGSVAVGRSLSIGTMRTAGFGLLLTGLFSLALTLSPSISVFVAAALLIASVGNPFYTVANQTALVESANSSNRGSVMASRFGIVQAASIAGTAAGGILTKQFGPLAAYGVLAIGLILLGMFALAAGRRRSNPLHGRAYEEATLLAAGVPTQAE
jgi:putative nucleotidyltransferase with HDIG domain